jgi:hypothetical protein
MQIPGQKERESILAVLYREGYTEVVDERPYSEKNIVEVKNPKINVIMVIYIAGTIVIAFSSKVDHSGYSDPELTEMEEDLLERFAAAA